MNSINTFITTTRDNAILMWIEISLTIGAGFTAFKNWRESIGTKIKARREQRTKRRAQREYAKTLAGFNFVINQAYATNYVAVRGRVVAVLFDESSGLKILNTDGDDETDELLRLHALKAIANQIETQRKEVSK
ncbi:hypothetical protein K6U17_14435 [Vibrio fluvialis]|uniref:hypothetical protein n=1 Tax=Vibrio fluvialis TaxID=676 RepID=UPI001EEAE662|nr:hypothetical protein [Vibrio fluvialis]MCG6410416.1 hypothetical protein [Vibrio fluvialis]